MCLSPGQVGRTVPLLFVLALSGCGSTGSTSPTSPTASLPRSATLLCSLGTSDCSSVMLGQPVTFTASRGDNTTIRSADLDFGDGTPHAALGDVSTPASLTHNYTQTGRFTAVLQLTDANGGQSALSQPVVVGTLVTAALSASAVGGLSVSATAVVQGGTVARYEWIFELNGPVIVTTGPSSGYSYSTAGWKDLVLHVVLTDGRTVTASGSVVVE